MSQSGLTKQEPNKDTYQTIKTGNVVTEINLDSKPKYKIMVCTPCHSECIYALHTSSIKVSTRMFFKNNILVSFTLLKSS